VILWSPRPAPDPLGVDPRAIWLSVAGLIAAPAIAIAVARRGPAARRRGAVTLATALLVLTSLLAGPLALVAGLGMGTLGALARD
jgi:hypothetical protein